MSMYQEARERYAAWGVDADSAIAKLKEIPVSIHCWQGDDVTGLENAGEALSGGIQTTGNYPGKARTPEELMADFEKAIKETLIRIKQNSMEQRRKALDASDMAGWNQIIED